MNTHSTAQTLIIDDEFRDLLHPLTPAELAELEKDILSDGCLRPLDVWGNIILDGHHRYEICTRHGIPFDTHARHFNSRESAMEWMVLNQFARRNYAKVTRIDMVLRLKDKFAAGAEARKRSNLKTGDEAPDRSEQTSREEGAGETREKLAALADVSPVVFGKGDAVLARGWDWLREDYREEVYSTDAAYFILRAFETSGKKGKKSKPAPSEVLDSVTKWRAVCGDEFVWNGDKSLEYIDIYNTSPDLFAMIDSSGVIQIDGETDGKNVDFFTASYPECKAIRADYVKALRIIAAQAKKRDAAEAGRQAATPDNVTLQHGDFRRLMAELDDGSIDVILTDPPYPGEYVGLYGELAELAANKLADGGLCIVYAGQSYLPQILSDMSAYLDYIWMLSHRHEKVQSRQWTPGCWNSWKPIIVWSRGRPKHEWFNDEITGDAEARELHHWQQRLSGAVYLLDHFSYPGQAMLDPMCGSGTFAVAGMLRGLNVTGYDIDADNINIAKGRIHDQL